MVAQAAQHIPISSSSMGEDSSGLTLLPVQLRDTLLIIFSFILYCNPVYMKLTLLRDGTFYSEAQSLLKSGTVSLMQRILAEGLPGIILGAGDTLANKPKPSRSLHLSGGEIIQ